MKKLIGTVILLVISFTTSVASENTMQAEIQLLNELEQDNSGYSRNLFIELGKSDQFDSMPITEGLIKIKARSSWLSERVQKPDSDYRLAYALAIYQWKIGDFKDSALTLVKADLRAFVDGQRCQDKSSLPARTAPWRNAAKPVYLIIQSASPELKVEIQKVIQHEEKLISVRTPSAWICSGGIKQLVKLLRKYPEIGAHDISKPIPQSLLDKYQNVISVENGRVVLSDYSIQPDLIEDKAWQQNLIEIIEAFKNSYHPILGIN